MGLKSFLFLTLLWPQAIYHLSCWAAPMFEQQSDGIKFLGMQVMVLFFMAPWVIGLYLDGRKFRS